jgi:transcriptional regulator with XRE-family HTH domain
MIPIKLRIACAILNINAKELAELAGLAPITVQEIMRGKRRGGNQTLVKLDQALKINGIEFYDPERLALEFSYKYDIEESDKELLIKVFGYMLANKILVTV